MPYRTLRMIDSGSRLTQRWSVCNYILLTQHVIVCERCGTRVSMVTVISFHCFFLSPLLHKDLSLNYKLHSVQHTCINTGHS